MKISTKSSFVGKIADYLGVNKTFHEYTEIDVDPNDDAVISPVEAKIVHIGRIDQEGVIVSKGHRKVLLEELIGDHANQFLNRKYINFYLNPSNKHFWITPYDGVFTYTQKNEGRSWLPVCIGLENILGIEMLSKAIKRNASIGSIFKTKDFSIAMIAVGSLNVNRVHIDYEGMKKYKKGTPCGYFSVGSSMLLCFPDNLRILVEEESNVKIGQKILT
ncbi:MAG: phosphatidylserine decarboxylase [Candidatus Pacebacteria bacterium]|nr:phosphatidylserine decarboxylase [Candidatus Paceibacterota bacterium]